MHYYWDNNSPFTDLYHVELGIQYSSMLRSSGMHYYWDNSPFTDLYHVELGDAVFFHTEGKRDAVLLDQHRGRWCCSFTASCTVFTTSC